MKNGSTNINIHNKLNKEEKEESCASIMATTTFSVGLFYFVLLGFMSPFACDNPHSNCTETVIKLLAIPLALITLGGIATFCFNKNYFFYNKNSYDDEKEYQKAIAEVNHRFGRK